MSRYGVKYLPGGIQHDVGLTLTMRKVMAPVKKQPTGACTPNITGLEWYDGMTWAAAGDAGAPAYYGNGVFIGRLAGDLCCCTPSYSLHFHLDGEMSGTWDWTNETGWSPVMPDLVNLVVIPLGLGMVIIDNMNRLVYDIYTLSITVKACDMTFPPIVINGTGA